MQWKAFLLVMVLSVSARGQAAPSSQPADVPLGAVFESRVAGIELNPPVGATIVREIEGGDLVRFVYPDRNWELKIRVVHLAKPVPLSLAPVGNLSGGLLEMTSRDLKGKDPSAEVLLQDVRDYSSYKVGMIAARCAAGVGRELVEQAIFRADDQDFYTLQLSTPGRLVGDKTPGDDPGEVLAAATFDKVLNTVKLLDRSELKHEQDQRLFHSRDVFATWNQKKLKAALIPEQYLRVIQEGKDVGYVQVKEHLGNHAGMDGIEIEMRSSKTVEPVITPTTAPVVAAPSGLVVPTAVDAAQPTIAAPTVIHIRAESKMFVTFDRWHEDWSILTSTDTGQGTPISSSELGNSDMTVRRMLDREKDATEWKENGKHDKQPPIIEAHKYSLSVSQYTKTTAGLPVQRDLPVFYLPQALGQLLPRLLPLDQPQGYLFASYVSNQKEVMARYVDVLPQQEVELQGQRYDAIPVKDRVGVEGASITHYLTREGQWLGSVSDDQKLMILPSDEQTLEKIWKDAVKPPVAEKVR